MNHRSPGSRQGRQGGRPFHAVPATRCSAPARHFSDLDAAIGWACRAARRCGVNYVVFTIGDHGISINRVEVDAPWQRSNCSDN